MKFRTKASNQLKMFFGVKTFLTERDSMEVLAKNEI